MFDRQRSYSDSTKPGTSLIDVPASHKKAKGVPEIFVNDKKISNSVNSSEDKGGQIVSESSKTPG